MMFFGNSFRTFATVSIEILISGHETMKRYVIKFTNSSSASRSLEEFFFLPWRARTGPPAEASNEQVPVTRGAGVPKKRTGERGQKR